RRQGGRQGGLSMPPPRTGHQGSTLSACDPPPILESARGFRRAQSLRKQSVLKTRQGRSWFLRWQKREIPTPYCFVTWLVSQSLYRRGRLRLRRMGGLFAHSREECPPATSSS